MIKTLFRGVGSGFGRVLGRFIGTLFIGVAIYILLNALDIDISTIISKFRGYIL